MAAMTLEQWLARLKPGETPVFRHTNLFSARYR